MSDTCHSTRKGVYLPPSYLTRSITSDIMNRSKLNNNINIKNNCPSHDIQFIQDSVSHSTDQ